MASKLNEQQKILQISQERRAACKVLIVNRDSLSSGILANALMHDIRCDAEATHSGDLLRVLGTSDSALVIISADLGSRSGNGFDLAARVSAAYPDIPIVLLLDDATREAVIRAFHSGARGVFSREQSITELIDCVEHVRKGLMWAGQEVSDVFLEAFRNLPTPSTLTGDESRNLTRRELQVVQCAARGKSNRAIAGELCLSEHTVKNYLFRAFEKLGVTSRVELLFHLTVRGQTLGPPMPELDSRPEGVLP